MKKIIILTLLCINGWLLTNAQNIENRWSFESYYAKEFYMASLGNSFKNFTANQLYYGQVGFGFNRYLNKSFDAGAYLGGGFFEYSINDDKALVNRRDTAFLRKKIDGVLVGKYKFNNGYILREDHWFAPYAILGFGASLWDEGFDAYNGIPKTDTISGGKVKLHIPIGVGFKFNFNQYFAIQYQATYNLNFNDATDGIAKTSGQNIFSSADNYLKQSLGIVISFGQTKNSKSVGKVRGKDSDKDGVPNKIDKCANTPMGVKVDTLGCPLDTDKDGVYDYKDKCPNTPTKARVDSLGCPLDSDKDGVADYQDSCPTVKGLVALKGCPDADGDGVADYLDKCPNTARNLKVDSTGCPVDTDKDSIPDYQDSCPNVKGLKVFFGCPDSDGDGIPDKDDKCPLVAGTKENRGCPEIKKEIKDIFRKALQGIQFATGKDIILKPSFPLLNQIAKIMKENPSYKLLIHGHTDNVGDSNKNKELSEKRAIAVKLYLMRQGVEELRMKAAGFGDTMPVANNKTAAGKKQNRRVEFIVEF